MNYLQSAFGRLLFGLIFLATVNVLSGVLAVEFDYPSLWGNREHIFAEYAYPLPYGWALAHWLSMLPLALLVTGMPMWTKQMIIKARWMFLVGVVICLLVEVDVGRGHLRHIPFVLFLVVDLVTALLFTFIFFTPLKLLIGIPIVLAISVAGMLIAPGIHQYLKNAWEPKPDSAVIGPLLVPADIVTRNFQHLIEYHIKVSATVAPGKYPTQSQICVAAEQVLADMLVKQPVTEGFHSIVYFWSHPWFEADRDVLYPSGYATTNNLGTWECDFVYPTESDR